MRQLELRSTILNPDESNESSQENIEPAFVFRNNDEVSLLKRLYVDMAIRNQEEQSKRRYKTAIKAAFRTNAVSCQRNQ